MEKNFSLKSFIITALLIILFLGIVIPGGYYLYRYMSYTRVIAEFDDAEPLPPKMSVFYKGFNIGKVTKVQPHDDYTKTEVHLLFFPADLQLPKNVSARVKNYRKKFDYIDIVYPQLPSETMLKNGDRIKGKTSASVEAFINEQAENGTLDIIVDNVSAFIETLNNTTQNVGELFKTLNNTVKENQRNINQTTRNLELTTRNLRLTTLKINKSVKQDMTEESLQNLNETTKNIKEITKSIECATGNLTQTMNQVNSITNNVDDITCTVAKTLKARMGGMRLLFGKPEACCKKKACPCKR